MAQAHEDIAGKRVFLLNEKAWIELNEMLDAPPRVSPALHKLLTSSEVDYDTLKQVAGS